MLGTRSLKSRWANSTLYVLSKASEETLSHAFLSASVVSWLVDLSLQSLPLSLNGLLQLYASVSVLSFPHLNYLFCLFLIELWLIYNILLMSAVRYSDSTTYTLLVSLFKDTSHIGCKVQHTLVWSDILTHYTCNNPISKPGHILQFWEDRNFGRMAFNLVHWVRQGGTEYMDPRTKKKFLFLSSYLHAVKLQTNYRHSWFHCTPCSEK